MKKITPWSGFALLSAMALMSSVSPLRASISVPIVNPGFESPVVAIYNEGPITGWGQQAFPTMLGGYGRAGVWNPTAAGGQIAMAAINGDQAGYAGNGPAYGDNGAFIYQDVGPVVLGATYDLSLLVGQRTDYAIGDYQIALGTVSGGTFTAWASALNPVVPTAGTWAPASLTFTNTTNSGDLYIILAGGLSAGGQAQASFDNVSLLSTVPEPGSLVVWSLFGCVVVGAVSWRRNRRP